MHRLLIVALALVLGCLSACSPEQSDSTPVAKAPEQTPAKAELIALDVYKSPTCGCCGDWMKHLDESGFTTSGHHPEDLAALKTDRQIPEGKRSCHTAVSPEGFVFEGHVPAKFIHQFLASPPKDAIGLTVPGMPVGSPGMEMEDRFTPYDILLLKADGETEVYVSVPDYQSQF